MDILWRDRVTYVSPANIAASYIADVAVSRNQRQYGDYTKHSD
jgi:hypothetical protein